MTRIRPFLLIISAIFLAVFSCVYAPRVHADTADEVSLSRINEQLDSLWEFVEASAEVPDEGFYPEFITKAQHAHDEIGKTYDELAYTKETKNTKRAIQVLREDIKLIQADLLTWQDAAAAKDATAFEEASYMLADTVDTYSQHIEDYDAAAYGTVTIVSIGFYIGQFLLAFFASSLLFAWAIYKNYKTDNVVQEILRKLRWRIAYLSLGMVAFSAIPAYLYFFTDILQPTWVWGLLLLPAMPVAYTVFMYAKMSRVSH
jgi:hypothetical protein